jgi:hypothetical protein
MKILIISKTSKPFNDIGSKRHMTLAKLLSDKGLETDVLISNINYVDNKKYRPSSQKNVKVINCYFQGNSFVKRTLSIIEFSIKIHFIKERGYDIVIGSSPDLVSCLSAYFFSLSNKSKFVLEIRDIWPLSITELTNINYGVTLLKKIELFLYKRSEFIISPIVNIKDYFIEINKKYLIKKTLLLPQTLDTSGFKQESSINLTSDNYLKIIYSGSVRYNNHLSEIIQYLQYANTTYGNFFEVTVMGDGASLKAIKKIASRMKFKIDFKKSNKSNEIISEISQHDLGISYIIDSKLYSYGIAFNKSVDFIAAKTPLAVIGGKGIPDFYETDDRFKLNHDKEDFAEFIFGYSKLNAMERQDIKRNLKDLKTFTLKKQKYLDELCKKCTQIMS